MYTDWFLLMKTAGIILLAYVAACGFMRFHMHNQRLKWEVKNGYAEEHRIGGREDE